MAAELALSFVSIECSLCLYFTDNSRFLLMSHRFHVNFIEGFRPMIRSDTSFPFRANHPIMDNYTLTDYFVWGSQSNSMSIVKQVMLNDGTAVIAAVAFLTIHEDYVKVEMIARNRLPEYEAFKGSGFDLLLFGEQNVARANGFHEVRLQAIAGMPEQYKKKGYVEIPGASFNDEKWGLLTTMVKRV